LVSSGIALAMPPVPVLVPAPVPVRRNQSSTVNVLAFSAGAAPKVTYWLEPLSCTPPFAEAVDWPEAGAEATDWLPAASTAVTT
jgi:hypothetical protein